MKTLFISTIILLSGCALNPPVIKTVDRVVEVPVSTPCKIRPVVKPEMDADNLKKEYDLDRQVAIVLSERERRKAYELELEAAIKECQ